MGLSYDMKMKSSKRVLVFGATGTAGQGAVKALLAAGHQVSCVLRKAKPLPEGAKAIVADVTQPMKPVGTFDVVVSCIASRTGTRKDAWAIDHDAQLNVLKLAQASGVQHFILLSAICVQKPKLPFQFAKLAFEKALIASGIDYSIVRPTAFFKSLSGQIDRLRKGKPFLVFGNGTLTACKPISDDDLGRFVADCIDNPDRRNQILPIGGPGPAIMPLNQAEVLGRLMSTPIKVRHVPVGLLRAIYTALGLLGKVIPSMADKSDLARIGHYYATESMLVLDPDTGEYSADATPSTGSETLFDHYKDIITHNIPIERGDHSVF